MIGIIRPAATSAHYPLPLQQLRPPSDSPLEGSDLPTLKANAAKYAEENPTNYRDILNAYEQVWHAASTAQEQFQIQRIVTRHLDRMDQAADKTIAAYRKRMEAAVTSGDTEAALRVWSDFPTGLRSFRHEAKIWIAFTNTLPADALQKHVSQNPIRYGHPEGGAR